MVACVEGNMCGPALRGANALPRSENASRAKGTRRNLGGLIVGRNGSGRFGPHRGAGAARGRARRSRSCPMSTCTMSSISGSTAGDGGRLMATCASCVTLMTSLSASNARPTRVGSSMRCVCGLRSLGFRFIQRRRGSSSSGALRHKTASGVGLLGRRPSTFLASPTFVRERAKAASFSNLCGGRIAMYVPTAVRAQRRLAGATLPTVLARESR